VKRFLLFLTVTGVLHGQAPTPPPVPAAAPGSPRLTLQDAESAAVRQHPQISAALLNAAAANQVTIETHAASLPTFYGSLTAAGAIHNSNLTAGNLNSSAIYNRLASGITGSQLLTDFGRTAALTTSARQRAEALQDNAQATRANVLLQVDVAFYAALRAQNVLIVAQETVGNRQTITDQVTALAGSKLKSGLDVSFANVNLGEAKLLLADAQNQIRAAFADLSAAMGSPVPRDYRLVDPGDPTAMPPDPAPLIQQAEGQRPEVLSARAQVASAQSFARAESDLKRPSISALGAVGVNPVHDDTKLASRYAAAGVNMNIPVFNGHLFQARQTEAEIRAQAAEQVLRDQQNKIARDVQVAWLNADNAQKRLALTADLLAQANLALDLATTRYNLGLSSIVELSQAQLQKTSAEIGAASAKYDYGLQRAVLDYQVGVTK
jgi:outer membrane protein